jgi:hypothetical protein
MTTVHTVYHHEQGETTPEDVGRDMHRFQLTNQQYAIDGWKESIATAYMLMNSYSIGDDYLSYLENGHPRNV